MSNLAIDLHPKYIRSASLGEEITELFGFITAANYELLVKIREFDQEGLWELEGIVSCAQWLNWKCGIGMNAAREKVRVANALGELEKISAAFASGEISYSKVRAMTRVATVENEAFLLKIARTGTAHHVETVCSGYRRAKDLNEVEIAVKQHEKRSLYYRYDSDGSMILKGRFPAEVGALIVKALDRAVERAEAEVAETRKAEEATGDYETDDDVSAVTSNPPRKPFTTSRADALANMAECYLAHGDQSSSSADRYQVMLHVSAETLSGEEHGETETSHIENGPHVTAETSRRICCDSSISVLKEDENGEPLSIGRKSRVIPPPIRRALRARDKGCRFPGCTHQYFIDGHHIKHWSQGGETSMDNLVLLCRHHHRLVHEGGFVCEKDSAGRLVFKDQRGVPIRQTGQVIPFKRNYEVHKLKEKLEDRHIHAQTCVSEWAGESFDKHHIVSLLCEADHPN